MDRCVCICVCFTDLSRITHPSNCFKIVARVAAGPHIMPKISHMLFPLMIWTSSSAVPRSTCAILLLAVTTICSIVQPNIIQTSAMQTQCDHMTAGAFSICTEHSDIGIKIAHKPTSEKNYVCQVQLLEILHSPI